MLDRSAIVLDSVTRVPKIAAVLAATTPTLHAGEQVALTTYETINKLFSSTTNAIAELIIPSPTFVTPTGIKREHNIVSQTQSSSIALAYPTYTTVVNGVSENYLDQSLTSLRSDVLSTVAGIIQPIVVQGVTNMNSQQVSMIQDITGLIVRNGDFHGGTLSDAISVSATNGSFNNLCVNNFFYILIGGFCVFLYVFPEFKFLVLSNLPFAELQLDLFICCIP